MRDLPILSNIANLLAKIPMIGTTFYIFLRILPPVSRGTKAGVMPPKFDLRASYKYSLSSNRQPTNKRKWGVPKGPKSALVRGNTSIGIATLSTKST